MKLGKCLWADNGEEGKCFAGTIFAIAVGYTVHTHSHMALGLFKYVVEQILSNLTRRKNETWA